MDDSRKAAPNFDPLGSNLAIESSTTTANVTSVASYSKPVTNVQSTIETTTSKPKATNQNKASPNKDEQLASAVAISESKPKSAVTPSVPSAASTVSTTIAKPSDHGAKTDSPSNDALVSTNIERSTTTLTETSTMTSTSTQWTRTQSPQGTIRYRENTDVRVQSAVDKKTITKEKSTLTIKASEGSANAKPESKSSANEKPESKSSANEKPESKSSANEKPESKSSANEKPESKSSANEKPESKSSANEKLESKSSANEKPESKSSANEKPESKSSANEKPESKSSANEKPESKSSANEKPVSKQTDGSALITAGVGLTLIPVDKSPSGAPQTKNPEISEKENEVPNNQIVKSDGSVRISETGSENDHTGNALEVILMTDDGNKKPEKSPKSETSEKKSNKKTKKKQKKSLNAVKSSKMSAKDSNIVKKYNRQYFGQSMVKFGPPTFNFRTGGILI